MQSGNLNFLEHPGPLQACNGTALPLYLIHGLLHNTKSYRAHKFTIFNILWNLRFQYLNFWGFGASDLWRRVAGLVFPDVRRKRNVFIFEGWGDKEDEEDVASFDTWGNTDPATRRHTPARLNSSFSYSLRGTLRFSHYVMTYVKTTDE
jgi:hypothetical protein